MASLYIVWIYMTKQIYYKHFRNIVMIIQYLIIFYGIVNLSYSFVNTHSIQTEIFETSEEGEFFSRRQPSLKFKVLTQTIL